MPDERPLLAELRDEVRHLAGDVQEMAAARWELARLELRADAASAKRLAIGLGVAAALGVTALSLLAVAAAYALRDRLHIPFAGWLAIFSVVLISVAALIGCLARRRFRRDFTALAETREELREDLVWLKEWACGNDESP